MNDKNNITREKGDVPFNFEGTAYILKVPKNYDKSKDIFVPEFMIRKKDISFFDCIVHGYLLPQSKKDPTELPIKIKSIANRLTCEEEKVLKALNKLEKKGYIKITKNKDESINCTFFKTK
jgi:hypothetical protein